VNVGSALTPIGNPQNLFIWQTRGIGFGEFMAAMLPLVGLLTLSLVLATVLAFPARPVVVRPAQRPVNRRLLWVSCLLYPGFIVAAEVGAAVVAALANLIALRLARVEGLWREFHLWSLPALVLALGVAALAHYVV